MLFLVLIRERTKNMKNQSIVNAVIFSMMFGNGIATPSTPQAPSRSKKAEQNQSSSSDENQNEQIGSDEQAELNEQLGSGEQNEEGEPSMDMPTSGGDD